MAKLHQNITKAMKKTSPSYAVSKAVLGEDKTQEIYDKVHPIGTQLVEARDQAKAAEAAAAAEENEPTIPLPDEEELARVRRRRARRSTGRESTMLTNQERFGV